MRHPYGLTPSEQKAWDLHQSGKAREEIAVECGITLGTLRQRLLSAADKLRAAKQGSGVEVTWVGISVPSRAKGHRGWRGRG